MKAHLSEEQWAEVLTSGAEDAAAEHLAECGACRGEVERMRAALGGFGAAARADAERPEGFWTWQRRAIRARLEHGPARTQRLAWASALVLLVLMAVALHFQAQPERLATRYDPDEALLVDVERTVRSNGPSALRPATLLSWEMDQAAQASNHRLKPPMNANERR
jgi:predicted anti-sigma-YlaC factor YlaD